MLRLRESLEKSHPLWLWSHLYILTPDSFKTCICLKATTVFICVPAQSALGIVEIQVSFKIGTIALISVLLFVVLQLASLKLALLFLIIDVSWVAHAHAHAVKGTRMFITNAFLLMQAFKMIRQEKLSHVCKVVKAICPPTLSYTSQVRYPVQIIAVYMCWVAMKLSTVKPVHISTTSAVTGAVTWGMP